MRRSPYPTYAAAPHGTGTTRCTPVGGFTAAFSAGYHYAVSQPGRRSPGLVLDRRAMALSVGAGLLQNITDGDRDQEPNARAATSRPTAGIDHLWPALTMTSRRRWTAPTVERKWRLW